MKKSAIFTDLYQLTMMCAYLHSGKTETACFELFVRKLPKNRNYLVFSGIYEVLKYVENLRFTKEEIDYLYSLKLFPDWFLDFLKDFSFEGSIYSMEDGTVFFPYEPVLRVEAPIYQAQLLETALMNYIHIASLIATKASRVSYVARGKVVVDFSLRRTHGFDAGMITARSSFLVGFHGTSNVLAGKVYGIPVVGTVAHSFIMSFETEEEAFRAYVETFPENSILLVDTYDTVEGIKHAIETAKYLMDKGYKLKGIRLDSGDLVELSFIARNLLDSAGLKDAKIIASGGLDEFEIKKILDKNAPIDGFGVGTKVGTSADSPYIDFVYKLVEVNGKPVMKKSPGKKMYPGKKQVFRKEGEDVVALWEEKMNGTPLLEEFMKNGKVVKKEKSLKELRERFLEEFKKFPEEMKYIDKTFAYPVKISEELEKLFRSFE